jgi:CheY-like chemotaxis protein
MKKILLIEDHEEVRDNIQDVLEMEGFEIFAAQNGKIGIQLAREQLPDLIICDVMMPEMDGHSVVKALRQDERTAHIPFIFLTAKAFESDRKQGMELGADYYMTKPFSFDDFLQVISTYLEKKRM